MPIQKAIHLGTLFVLNGLLYSCGAYYFQHADLHICIFYFHMYVSLAYIVILIEIFVLENKCSKIASAIVAQGVELSNKKTFGLSQNAYFILYFVIPILGTSLISFHTIYYSFHSQTVFSGCQVREGQLAVLIDYEGAQNLVPLFGEQVNDVLFANAFQIDK